MTGTAVARPARPASAAEVDTDRRKKAHFPCFDGFRAVAAMSVLITHVSFISRVNNIPAVGVFLARLDIGVAFFFLISGFLLYRPFVAAHLAGRPAPRLRPYLRRRALRIFPAYWLALTVSLFVFHSEHHLGLRDLVIFYGLLQIYDRHHLLHGLTPAWSLCTEVSFYLFLPAWAWLLRRAVGPVTTVSRRVGAELVGLVGLYAVSVVFRLFVLSSWFGGLHIWWFDADRVAAQTWLPAMLDYFSLGMALAVLSAWAATDEAHRLFAAAAEWLGDRAWLCWTLGGLTFWTVSTHIGLPVDLRPYGRWVTLERQLLYGITAFFLLLPGIFGPQRRGAIRAFLLNPVVQWVGLVSYGVYLWHDIWIAKFLEWTGYHPFTGHLLVMLGFVVVLTLAASALSYAVVEKPALSLKTRSPAGAGRRRAGERA